MKILYLSCHEVLEYDEVKLLHELGHEVFSAGAYADNAKDGSPWSGFGLRPGIEGFEVNEDWKEQYRRLCNQYPGEDVRLHLIKDFIDNFDCVIVMHIPNWIIKNWNVMKHKRVIWRTIGQSISKQEQALAPYRQQGLEIVRYSPKERDIPNFIGEDTIIRFYKDPNEYGPWNGNRRQLITIAQNMKERDAACNFTLFELVTRPFPRLLLGSSRGFLASWTTGKVSFDRLKRELCNNRVYFYTGTHPASYTLGFIEAWMTGIPIVAIGERYGNADYFPGHKLYEVHQLIQHGETGFVSDNPAELRDYCQQLLDDHDLATRIGSAGRAAAIELFGKEKIKLQWQAYLSC